MHNLSAQEYFTQAKAAIDTGELIGKLPPSDKPRLLLAGGAWGRHYVDMLVDYCLPSIASSIASLCEYGHVFISLHTDSQSRIDASDAARMLKAMGATFIYHSVDPNSKLDKYIHLGLLQSIDLLLAKAMGAHYHLLMPDHIYSEKHFTGLMKAVARGHKVITRLNISTKREIVCSKLEYYRHADKTLKIPAGDLIAIGLNYLHPRSEVWMATNLDIFTEMPGIHVAGFEGRDTLHLFSGHQTILYLDKSIISRIETRLYVPLDGDLYKIIPADVPIYCSRPEDEMTMIEVAPAHIPGGHYHSVDLAVFCSIYWSSVSGASKQFANMEVIDPINRDLLLSRAFMNQSTLNIVRATLLKALGA